jgi:hypothetical protein
MRPNCSLCGPLKLYAVTTTSDLNKILSSSEDSEYRFDYDDYTYCKILS